MRLVAGLKPKAPAYGGWNGDASVLTGEHANTEILKFVGYERIYQLTGDKPYEDAARNFWEDVTANRSWANDRADGGEAV